MSSVKFLRGLIALVFVLQLSTCYKDIDGWIHEKFFKNRQYHEDEDDVQKLEQIQSMKDMVKRGEIEDFDDALDEGFINRLNLLAGKKIEDPNDKNSVLDQEDIMMHSDEFKRDMRTRRSLFDQLTQHVRDLINKVRGIENDYEKDATTNETLRWDVSIDKPIVYHISDNLGEDAREAIKEAMEEYEHKTCIGFVEMGLLHGFKHSLVGIDFIYFEKLTGCWSHIGRQGGMQVISIAEGCEWRKTVIHEIMHALGFWHEQSRPDRDNYVRIAFENIDPKQKHNFKKQEEGAVTNFGTSYDYKSIMHYPRKAFSINGKQTIIALGKSENFTIGQSFRNGHMSEVDRQEINAMYKCGMTFRREKL